MRGAVLVGALALALGGCSKPKPGTAEAEAALPHKESPAQQRAGKDFSSDIKLENVNGMDLMPRTVGSKWTYSMELVRTAQGQPPATGKAEFTYEITAIRQDGDKTRFQLATTQNGKRIDEQVWYVDKSGYYQLSLGTAGRPFTPPQPVVKFPLRSSDSFTWQGTSPVGKGNWNKGKLEGKVIGIQSVDTDLGSTRAVFVESASVIELPKGKKGLVVTDTFFRPKVGIVRYQQTTRTQEGSQQITLRLKDYTIK